MGLQDRDYYKEHHKKLKKMDEQNQPPDLFEVIKKIPYGAIFVVAGLSYLVFKFITKH